MNNDQSYSVRPPPPFPAVFLFNTTQSPEGSSSGAVLLPKRDMDYNVNSFDLPAWGQLEVFNSRPDAFRSISIDERQDQHVRLLHVANNVQLKRMLLPGREICGPGAELYLRVAPTCPLYYTRWTTEVDQATIEFTPKVPQSGSRAEVLRAFSQVEGQPFATPVIGRVVPTPARGMTVALTANHLTRTLTLE